MDSTLSALNRFGLGARPGERDRVRDPQSWLRRQLDGGPPLVAAPDIASGVAIGDAVRAQRMPNGTDEAARRQARRRLVSILAAENRAALAERVTTERPFVERLVAFWSNHLCVSTAARLLVVPLAGSYEREVIRPHVLGRFEDMVLASAKHPAMLAYLDAFQSVGPSSPAGKAPARGTDPGRGLNENYARELLELHTLGVDGGYTQQDVRELARVLTGWTIAGLMAPPQQASGIVPRRPGRFSSRGPGEAVGPLGFAFRDRQHEPGSKQVLKTRYADDGVREGERAIRDLCRHPATAAFVSRKLVQHFVADQPPVACVERVTRTFLSTNGDLKAVAQALVDAPESWTTKARKFRTPQDWLIAVLRALPVSEAVSEPAAVLRQLRHPLWAPASPKGFGDTVTEWADPDALLNRAELSRTIGRRLGQIRLDLATLAEVVDVPTGDPLYRLLGDRSIQEADRLALAIAGPAFQWR